MTAIVIPAADVVADADKLLRALLFSIEHACLQDTPVIVCYDACKPAFINHIQDKYPFVHALVNKGNRANFAGNANMGLRYAHAQGWGAVVVNQDCVIPFEKHFRACMTGAGIVVPSPVSICAEPPITEIDLQNLDQSQPKSVIYTDHRKLVGFCMYFSKELMDKIGYFDEWFVSTFEDDDICARALLAGFPVQHVSVNVHHYGSRCGSYDGARLAINHNKFRMKWSVPTEIEHLHMNQWILDNHQWSEDMKEQ